MDDARIVDQLSRLSLALAEAPDESARLQLAVDCAVSLVPRCQHAGITLEARRAPATRASSDDVVLRADELQRELGEGPCLDVVRPQTIISHDLSTEDRWPRWSRRASADLAVRSMMSLVVTVEPHSHGTLSLYSGDGRRFDDDDLTVGRALAAQLSVIMTARREIDRLGAALDDRVVVGRAEGILMERLGMSAEGAFDHLRRASMQSNRKLVQIAREIADTGRLPVV